MNLKDILETSQDIDKNISYKKNQSNDRGRYVIFTINTANRNMIIYRNRIYSVEFMALNIRDDDFSFSFNNNKIFKSKNRDYSWCECGKMDDSDVDFLRRLHCQLFGV